MEVFLITSLLSYMFSFIVGFSLLYVISRDAKTYSVGVANLSMFAVGPICALLFAGAFGYFLFSHHLAAGVLACVFGGIFGAATGNKYVCK
ncbi:MAG: hypothetical protein K2X77_27345 [Candidatus Obscuribacterales bacterium]|nr:hypothetical protein [Candidatus Obscuribacterales bacterium]